MSYHRFKSPCVCFDGKIAVGSVLNCQACLGTGVQEHGSFEVFYVDPQRVSDPRQLLRDPGWYWAKTVSGWWACFPGCLPDGPFATEDEAIANMKEGFLRQYG